MSVEDLVGLLVPLTFVVFLVIEAIWPARPYPERRWWRLQGFAFLVLMAVIATLLPMLLPQDWVAAHRLIDGRGLGTVGGVIVGYAAVSLVNYGWHRATH